MKRSVTEVEACQEAHDQETWWSVRAHLTDCCSLKTQNKEPKAAVPLTSVSIHPLVKWITQSPCERWLVSYQSCFLSWPHEGNTQLEFSGDLSCVRVELRAASGLICIIKRIKINRCQVNSTGVMSKQLKTQEFISQNQLRKQMPRRKRKRTTWVGRFVHVLQSC